MDTGDGNVHTLLPEILIDSGSTVHLGVLKDMKTKGVVSGKYAIVNNTERMFDKGQLKRFVNVYLNDEDIRFLDNLNSPVKDGDQVAIIPAVAGG